METLLAIWVLMATLGHTSAFTVCMTSIPGVGLGMQTPTCDSDTQDPHSLQGAEWRIFKEAASSAGWTYDPTPAGLYAPYSSKRYGVRCLVDDLIDVNSFLADQLSADFNSSLCHAIGTNQAQWSAVLDVPQFKAAQPTMIYPLSVVIYDEGETPIDIWAFVMPLHWKLWLIFVITVVTLPVLIWLIENLAQNGFIPLNQQTSVDLRFAIYRNVLAIFTQDIMFVTTTGAQVTMVAFLFLCFVTISTYTASLASFLTLTTTKTTANSLKDFAGSPIAVNFGNELFVENMYGIYDYSVLTLKPGDTMVGIVVEAMRDLKKKKLKALIAELPLVLSALSILSDPKLRRVGKDVEFLFLAPYFAKDFPDDMLAAYDAGVITCNNNGFAQSVMGTYTAQYYHSVGADQGVAAAITYKQMFGLFLILYGSLGAALTFTGVVYLINKRKELSQVVDSTTLTEAGQVDNQRASTGTFTPKPPRDAQVKGNSFRLKGPKTSLVSFPDE